jgi:hypothetical protein
VTEKLADQFVVVVAARDPARAGRLADELRAHGSRVAVFVDGDEGADDAVAEAALVELVAELGRARAAGPSGQERAAGPSGADR